MLLVQNEMFEKTRPFIGRKPPTQTVSGCYGDQNIVRDEDMNASPPSDDIPHPVDKLAGRVHRVGKSWELCPFHERGHHPLMSHRLPRLPGNLSFSHVDAGCAEVWIGNDLQVEPCPLYDEFGRLHASEHRARMYGAERCPQRAPESYSAFDPRWEQWDFISRFIFRQWTSVRVSKEQDQ